MRPRVFVAVTLWLTPVMAVGVHAFGVPNVPAVVVGLDLSEPAGRVRLVQLALALISLGSFRSPFVGFYGLVGTFWLLTLLAAESRTSRSLVASLAIIAVYSACNWRVPSPAFEPTTFVLAASAVLFLIAMTVNLYALVRAVYAPRALEARRAAAVVTA